MCSTDSNMLPRTENPSVCCVADCCDCGAPGTAKTLITKSPKPMLRKTLLFMVRTPFIQLLRGCIVARFLPQVKLWPLEGHLHPASCSISGSCDTRKTHCRQGAICLLISVSKKLRDLVSWNRVAIIIALGFITFKVAKHVISLLGFHTFCSYLKAQVVS